MPAFKDFVEANPSVDFSEGASKFVMLDETGENAEGTVTALKAELSGDYAPLVYAQAGSGAPNGSVVGSVGDRYIDTAATLGARVWYKASGTATNTGWLVAEGDTGLRDISSLVDGTGTVYVQRSGNVVSMSFSTFDPASTTIWSPVTAGFRVKNTSMGRGVLVNAAGTTHVRTFWTTTAHLSIATIAEGTFGTLTWVTSDGWPAALPGTAI